MQLGNLQLAPSLSYFLNVYYEVKYYYIKSTSSYYSFGQYSKKNIYFVYMIHSKMQCTYDCHQESIVKCYLQTMTQQKFGIFSLVKAHTSDITHHSSWGAIFFVY